MRAVAILAHLMDENANLGPESLARLEMAVRLHEQRPFDLFLTTGWNYRSDCSQMIGDVMAQNLVAVHGIDESLVLVDTNSRDTVGDAYFLRKYAVVPMNILDLVIVTSDYHVARTEFIFRSFLAPQVASETCGAATDSASDDVVMAHERKSLEAFERTFEGVDFSQDSQVFNALRTKHPFYNGDVYERI